VFAKRRGFYRDGKEIIRTPLLLPSFSSKGFPEVQSILETTSEVIDSEILISAYDLHHNNLQGPFGFAEAIFLDSGGYEAGLDVELSDLGKLEHAPLDWTPESYQSIVSNWESQQPTIIISFDHPDIRTSTLDQIMKADETLPSGANIFREILFKPEKKDSDVVNVQAIVDHANRLHVFDSIGVTEKEIGTSQQQRMANIARIRQALNGSGLGDKPIHIFGSLDTISTPLYFVAGADIFDGLTWLRFSYHEGMTIYRHNYAAVKFGTQFKSNLVDARCSFENYYYIKELQLEMRTFLNEQSFDSFSYHADLIEKAFRGVTEEIGG
jgi:hypothetical protein